MSLTLVSHRKPNSYSRPKILFLVIRSCTNKEKCTTLKTNGRCWQRLLKIMQARNRLICATFNIKFMLGGWSSQAIEKCLVPASQTVSITASSYVSRNLPLGPAMTCEHRKGDMCRPNQVHIRRNLSNFFPKKAGLGSTHQQELPERK